MYVCLCLCVCVCPCFEGIKRLPFCCDMMIHHTVKMILYIYIYRVRESMQMSVSFKSCLY